MIDFSHANDLPDFDTFGLTITLDPDYAPGGRYHTRRGYDFNKPHVVCLNGERIYWAAHRGEAVSFARGVRAGMMLSKVTA